MAVSLGAAAAVVRTAEPSSQTLAVERPSTVADVVRESPTEEDKTLSDLVFSHAVAQNNDGGVDSARYLVSTTPFSSSDEATEHQSSKENNVFFDPLMAAANALGDPLAHPDAATTQSSKVGSPHASQPTSNGVAGNPPNAAGANGGGGQGAAGPSTPFSASGGGSGGGGAGPAAASFTSPELAAMTTGANGASAAAAAAPAVDNAATVNANAANTASASDTPTPTTPTTILASPDMQAQAVSPPPTPVPFTIYNTGVDDTGAPLADGAVDPHYQIIAAPTPYNNSCNAYAVDQNSFGFTVAPQWQWNADDNTSHWIGPVANEQNDPSGNYTYQTTFNLNGYDPSTAVLNGQYLTDDWLSEIELNGQVVATFPTGGATAEDQTWQSLPQIASNFVPGVNTLDFVVENRVQATGNPTGFRVELNGTADTASSPITVTGPGDQNNAEGDSVSLQIQTSGGNGPLSYGASNLPPGLTIDSSTGLISGTIDYTAAEKQGGLYPVTVNVYDNHGDSSNATFNWTVTHTNTTPVLDNPGDQTNWQGDAVALQLSASEVNGAALTYSATGLPNGLSLNTATGLISGVLAAADSGPYSVTVSASDGTTTVQQSFTWTVATVQVDPLADQSNLLGDNVSVPVNAFDQSGRTLTYSATGLPPGLSIDSATGLISGSIDNSASTTTPYNVTVTASDGVAPASTSFAWNLSGFTLDNPGDQTNAEGDAVALQPTVETNGNPTLTFSATGLPNGLSINPNTGLIAGTLANLDSNNGPYSVTVSATDGTSTSSQTFTWTVTHVLLSDPGDQINAAGDVVSLPIQASDPDGDTLSYTASGLPQGLSIDAATGLISGTIASTAGSDTPYSVTVTASDGTHTATDTFNWTVANQAVTVTNPGSQSNAEGDNVSLQINATDPAGNPLSYTALGLPPGLEIDYASGLISGTIDSSAAETNGGVYQVTVLADDGQGNNGSTAFTWNVSHVNQAPTLDNPGDQLNQAGDVVSLPLLGYDADGDTVSYTATGLPPALSIDSATGIISGTLPATAGSGTPYSVTVTASDDTLTAQQTFNWVVTSGPVTLTSPGDQTNGEGDSVSLQLSGTGDSTLTYTASGLPSGLSIDSGTGLISGTVSSGDAATGPYTVTVSAADTNDHSNAKQFTWFVNAANFNPVVSNPGSQINAQGDVLALSISASDPAGNGLTYSAVGLPPGLTIDSGSGLISGVLSASSATGSPYTVTVTANDGNYNGSTTFTWAVTNQTVTVTNPGTQSNNGGDTVSLQISANDPAQLPLTYTASGLPQGLSIDTSTGLISGTIDSSVGGTYTVTVMASDSQGNSGSMSFTWNVAYVNQTPTLDNPGDQLNNAGDAVSLPLYGYDVDGDTLSYSATGLPPGLSIDTSSGLISGTLSATAGSNTPYNVTVTVSDGTYQTSQTFNWLVTAAVVTLTSPGDHTNTEGDSVSLQLSGTGDSTLTYGANGLPSGLSIDSNTGLISGTVASGDAEDGPYTVTVTATDTQGNSTAQQFNWNINAPASVLTLTNPGAQSNAEGDNVSLQLQTSDDDGDSLEYTASGLPIGLFIDPMTGLIEGTVDYSAAEISGGQYNVTVTVNDGDGQTASQSFVWTIADTPQTPWLDYPTFQDSQDGTVASLQLVAFSPDGKTLTYSATGLPAGLSVDPNTGLISGTITAAMGSYTVTAMVSDGTLTATQTFTWQVTCGAAPQVILAINNSTDDRDHVLLMDSDDPVPMTVTLENAAPGLYQVQLSVVSPGMTLVSEPTVELSNGGSTTVMLTPKQASTQADDVTVVAMLNRKEVGDAKQTNEKVIFPEVIKNADTPVGMKPRIPPRRLTPVTIKLSVAPPPNSVLVDVEGNDPKTNGVSIFLHGVTANSRIYLNTTTNKVDLRGMTQTSPPGADGKSHAGNLYLQAKAIIGGPKLENGTKSSGFSVAAIPIIVKMKKPELAEGKEITKPGAPNKALIWGAVYPLEIISDSGQQPDLDQVKISEFIVPDPKATGIYKKDLKPPIKWNSATSTILEDKNARVVIGAPDVSEKKFALELETDIHLQKDDNGLTTHKGQSIVNQYYIFSDARTGVPANADGKEAMIVRASGFEITHLAEEDGNKFFVMVTRKAKANHGAEAGENVSSVEQKAQVKYLKD